MPGRLLKSLVLVALMVALPAPVFAAKAKSPLVAARMELNGAKSEAGRARLKVNQLSLKVKAKYEARADWKEAVAALNKAKAEYNAACRPALAAVKTSAEYKTLKARQQQARANLDTVRVAAFHAGGNFNAGGSDVREAVESLKQLEADAVASDPKAIAAKEKVEACEAKVDELKAALEAELSSDEKWVTAKQAADTAEQRLDSASTAYASAVTADKEQRKAAKEARRQAAIARAEAIKRARSAPS
jgi:hypothetical protein